MSLLRDIFSALKRVDLTLVGATITALQKFVFVLYIAANIWNGSLFESCNKYLMPKKPDTDWLSFFRFGDFDNCDTLTTLCLKHKCIRSMFLKDHTEVYSSAVSLQRFQKWYYLLIVMVLQVLAPFVYQLSLLLVPLIALMLQATLLKRLMHFLGYDSLWRRARLSINQLSSRSRVQRNEVNNFLSLSVGILTTSFAMCLTCTSSLREVKSGCNGPMCLYCYPRLMYTIFKEQVDDEYYYYFFGKSTRFVLSTAKFLTAALLSCLLYVMTVFALCLVAYILIDAVWNLWMTFRVLSQYAFRLSPKRAAHSLWNHTKDALQSPRNWTFQDSSS